MLWIIKIVNIRNTKKLEESLIVYDDKSNQSQNSLYHNKQTIHHRIIASYRDKEFYDGDRSFGYGGFSYDGRWLPIAENMCKEYALTDQSSVLQIGCDKGFLLHDFLKVNPEIKIRGTDISDYAIENAMDSIKPYIQKAPFTELPFDDGVFVFPQLL